MAISLFDLFSIGIGPSSSHTNGPMKAAYAFIEKLTFNRDLLNQTSRIQVELFGSLALTGRGHGTDNAILNGLEGWLPDNVNPNEVVPRAQRIIKRCKIKLAGKKIFHFQKKPIYCFNKKNNCRYIPMVCVLLRSIQKSVL